MNPSESNRRAAAPIDQSIDVTTESNSLDDTASTMPRTSACSRFFTVLFGGLFAHRKAEKLRKGLAMLDNQVKASERELQIERDKYEKLATQRRVLFERCFQAEQANRTADVAALKGKIRNHREAEQRAAQCVRNAKLNCDRQMGEYTHAKQLVQASESESQTSVFNRLLDEVGVDSRSLSVHEQRMTRALDRREDLRDFNQITSQYENSMNDMLSPDSIKDEDGDLLEDDEYESFAADCRMTATVDDVVRLPTSSQTILSTQSDVMHLLGGSNSSQSGGSVLLDINTD